jgi:glycosyltransferase involved in cell wall biosynthesis
MRLLYLGSTDLPQPKARAIQIVHTCHALARRGVDVSLVVGRRGRASMQTILGAYGLEQHPRLRIHRVPIVRIPPTAPEPVLRHFTRVWQASYLSGLTALLPRLAIVERPDVVFARDFRTAELASRVAPRLGARLIMEVHGLPSFEVANRAGRASASLGSIARLRELEDRVLERADLVVAITESGRQILLEDYRLPPRRVITVADGTVDRRAGARAAVRVDGVVSVYYVGQLYPWKGAGHVVESARYVRGARYQIVGGLPRRLGEDPDITALRRHAELVRVADRVEFRGYLPYARVQDELAGGGVAILPLPDEPVARYFTSPLKLFDYMQAGLAIVASDLPSVREVLTDEHNALLVPAGDAAAIGRAVQRLVDEPALRSRLGEAARADARGYSWDARAKRLCDAFGGLELAA